MSAEVCLVYGRGKIAYDCSIGLRLHKHQLWVDLPDVDILPMCIVHSQNKSRKYVLDGRIGQNLLAYCKLTKVLCAGYLIDQGKVPIVLIDSFKWSEPTAEVAKVPCERNLINLLR